MAKLLFKEREEYDGTLYEFQIFAWDSDKDIEDKKVRQVWGLVVDDENKVLIVSEDEKEWGFPGGTIENNETFIETLNREVYEEAAVKLDQNSISPLFSQDVIKISNGEEIYDTTQIRLFGRINKKEKFVSDPGGDTKFQKYIEVDELRKYIKWESIGLIANLLKEKLS
ncbi:MAG TPA: NUDIX hydrolase [bacterium]|nr:NUDIX hydrolase [bacterium]